MKDIIKFMNTTLAYWLGYVINVEHDCEEYLRERWVYLLIF